MDEEENARTREPMWHRRNGVTQWTEYDEGGDEDWSAETDDAWTRPYEEETEVTDDVERTEWMS
eukprot:2279731-Amphidinium_carterae.1